MKLYVIPALISCGLNTVLASIVLSLSIYHLYTDQYINPPVAPNREWMHLVKLEIPFASFWMVLSMFGIYVCMTKKQMWSSTAILVLYGICLGLAVYFAVTFGNQVDVESVDPEVLFKSSLKEIHQKGEDGWLPEWLDNVQKKSKICCGIKTFRDYEEFWPATPSRVPRSCCKDARTIPAACPNDLTQIPFPNTPDDYFKVETGCMDEIMETVRHHARESYQNSIIMATFIAVALFAYGVFYTRRYLDGPSDARAKHAILTAVGGGDGELSGGPANNVILENSSGPVRINSSGQFVSAIESAEVGGPAVLGSPGAVSFDPKPKSRKAPPTIITNPVLSTAQLQNDQQRKQFSQLQQIQLQQQYLGQTTQMNTSNLQLQMRPQPASQQQFSPAQLQQIQQQYQQQQQHQTFGGMPGNDINRDPYGGMAGMSYSTEQQQLPMQNQSNIQNLPVASSLDNIDQAMAEQLGGEGVGSPPGSPGPGSGRKKRSRRDGMHRSKPE